MCKSVKTRFMALASSLKCRDSSGNLNVQSIHGVRTRTACEDGHTAMLKNCSIILFYFLFFAGSVYGSCPESQRFYDTHYGQGYCCLPTGGTSVGVDLPPGMAGESCRVDLSAPNRGTNCALDINGNPMYVSPRPGYARSNEILCPDPRTGGTINFRYYSAAGCSAEGIEYRTDQWNQYDCVCNDPVNGCPIILLEPIQFLVTIYNRVCPEMRTLTQADCPVVYEEPPAPQECQDGSVKFCCYDDWSASRCPYYTNGYTGTQTCAGGVWSSCALNRDSISFGCSTFRRDCTIDVENDGYQYCAYGNWGACLYKDICHGSQTIAIGCLDMWRLPSGDIHIGSDGSLESWNYLGPGYRWCNPATQEVGQCQYQNQCTAGQKQQCSMEDGLCDASGTLKTKSCLQTGDSPVTSIWSWGMCGGNSELKITNTANMTPPTCINATKNPCTEPTFVSLYLRDASNNPTGDSIAVTGQATQNGIDISNQITWSCVSNPDNPGAYAPGGTCKEILCVPPNCWTGKMVSFMPNPPPAPTGREAPLSYKITAQINTTGVPAQDTKVITQDKLDELRQEYEDFPEVNSVERDRFDQVVPPEAFARLLHAPDIERTRFFTTENNGWHIVKDLIPHATELASKYTTGTLRITAGYRTPRGNVAAGGVGTSLHLYGKALDFNQQSTKENYNVWETAIKKTGAKTALLYDQNNEKVPTALIMANPWPKMPTVCSIKNNKKICKKVTAYTHGHADWK